MIQNIEFLPEFVDEATAHLITIESLLVSISDTGSNADMVNTMFRAIHSIKGTAGIFGLTKIVALSHCMENVFSKIRKYDLPIHAPVIDMMLSSIDRLKELFLDVMNSEDADIGFYTDELNRLLLSETPNDKAAAKLKIASAAGSHTISSGAICSLLYEATGRGDVVYDIQMPRNDHSAEISPDPVQFICMLQAVGVVICAIEVSSNESDTGKTHEASDIFTIIDKDEYHSLNILAATQMDKAALAEFLEMPVEQIQEVQISNIEMPAAPSVTSIKPEEISLADESCLSDTSLKIGDEPKPNTLTSQFSINVSIEKLDKLMDLIGELVVSGAMVTENPEITKLGIESFVRDSIHHRKIIIELNEMVMAIRMVPLAATFEKMNRLLHDASRKLGKKVNLRLIGQETEVDKRIAEYLSDPLMHLIRNAIDHGLETTDERIRKGKAESGIITLEAKNSGSDVLITVKDDGTGLDTKKIHAKAYANGLTQKSFHELSDREIHSFIFAPGFSTMDVATEFSGRGVGMDVVMKNMKSIGGSVEVKSKRNEGTEFQIKIPLTLSIMNGMLFTVGDSSYVIPVSNIRECFKPESKNIVSLPGGTEMLLIRGVGYPIIRLHKHFNKKTDIVNIMDGIILMVEDENGSCCIFADNIIGERQVVVKALPEYLGHIRGLSGCTLLGNGSISLIIDIGTLRNP